jgi:hypothetical protein
MDLERVIFEKGILWGFRFDFRFIRPIIKMLRIIWDKAHFVREKLPCSATPSRLRRTPSLGAKSETYLIHIQ